MNIYYIYLLLLLLMFILIYSIISENLKHSPVKVRVLSLTALMIVSFRYIALLIFLIIKNIKYIYLLKPLIFLNLLCLPIVAIVSIYIFVRNDRIKFNYCLVVSGLLLLLYVIAMAKLPTSIISIGSLGYLMAFLNKNLVYGIYVVLNTIFLFISIIFLGFKNSNKFGIWMVLFSSLTQISEIILRASGFIILPVCIFGDIFWILTVSYALHKLNK